MSTVRGRTALDGSPYPDRRSPTFEREIRAMFASIADGYDWFDHLSSLGGDFLWRPRALWDLDRFRKGRAPTTVLDIGTGPGNLAILAARRYPAATIVGVDVTRAMLERARTRRFPPAVRSRLGWAHANAGRLPFPRGTFDLIMSAFVIRSLPKLGDALKEFRRVLAPGGTLLTLEITEPEPRWFRSVFHAYFDSVVPWLGAAIGREGPYRYLPESLRSLPDRDSLLRHLSEAGFERAEAHLQSLGIVTTYLAEAPPLG